MNKDKLLTEMKSARESPLTTKTRTSFNKSSPKVSCSTKPDNTSDSLSPQKTSSHTVRTMTLHLPIKKGKMVLLSKFRTRSISKQSKERSLNPTDNTRVSMNLEKPTDFANELTEGKLVSDEEPTVNDDRSNKNKQNYI